MVFQHSAWPQSRPGDKHDYPLEVHRAVDAAGQEPHLHTGGAAACASGLHALHFTT